MPPSLSQNYCDAHELAIRSTSSSFFDVSKNTLKRSGIQDRFQVPMRLGGVGLKSCERTGPCAYWASRADSLSILRERNHGLYTFSLPVWYNSLQISSLLICIQRCTRFIQRQSNLTTSTSSPYTSWVDLLAGNQRPQNCNEEWGPGEWRKGWQYLASNAVEQKGQMHSLNRLTLLDKAVFSSSGISKSSK